jgi:hypothetical protein
MLPFSMKPRPPNILVLVTRSLYCEPAGSALTTTRPQFRSATVAEEICNGKIIARG